MENTIGRGTLRGRPLGDIAILVENRLKQYFSQIR